MILEAQAMRDVRLMVIRFLVVGLLVDTLSCLELVPWPSAAAVEPTNAEEAARKKQAADAAVNEKYQDIVAKLPPAEQAWEKVLEVHLGSFYLPFHKADKVAGRSNAWDFVKLALRFQTCF